jgi:hypothetical protein
MNISQIGRLPTTSLIETDAASMTKQIGKLQSLLSTTGLNNAGAASGVDGANGRGMDRSSFFQKATMAQMMMRMAMMMMQLAMQALEGEKPGEGANGTAPGTPSNTLPGIPSNEQPVEGTPGVFEGPKPNTGVSGTGSLWGSDNIQGANGQRFEFKAQPGKTYNLLSDSGVQVNGEYGRPARRGAEPNLKNIGIVDKQGNQVQIGADNSLKINGKAVTQDGTYTVGDALVTKKGDLITYDSQHYDMAFRGNGKELEAGFQATNAGEKRAPGGVWGQTLNAKDGNGISSNPRDFEVAGLTESGRKPVPAEVGNRSDRDLQMDLIKSLRTALRNGALPEGKEDTARDLIRSLRQDIRRSATPDLRAEMRDMMEQMMASGLFRREAPRSLHVHLHNHGR